jgi:hypothetical protein
MGRNDKQTKKPVEMSAHQVKAACYLISQAIGSPPQEIKADVNVNVRAQVQSIVAQYGEARARVALEALAPGLLAYLPSEGIAGELEAVDAEFVE